MLKSAAISEEWKRHRFENT